MALSFLKGMLFFVIGLVLLAIIIIFGKKYLYFYPIKAVSYYNKPNGVENIWIDHIHCWLSKMDAGVSDGGDKGGGGGRKLVIHCHGNAGNIGNREWLVDEFKRVGCDLLLFDYSGFGMSGKKADEIQLYLDAQKVYDHCIGKLGYNKSEIVMYGESIGCPVAMRVAQENDVDKVILQSGPHSILQFIWDHFPWGVGWLLSLFVRNDFPTHRYLEKYGGKCLIIHGKNDKLIGVNHAEKLNGCNDQAELLLVEGGHNVLKLDWDRIEKFIGS
jgi:pimeloyl-ACP methyl ester carboxylesterase